MDTAVTLFIIDPYDHGERGSEGNDSVDEAGPRTLPVLNLHPAVNIVSWTRNLFKGYSAL